MATTKEVGLDSAACRKWMLEWLDKAAFFYAEQTIMEYTKIVTSFLLWNRKAWVGPFRLQEYVNLMSVVKGHRAADRLIKALKFIFLKLPGENPAGRLKCTLQVIKRELPAPTEAQFRIVFNHISHQKQAEDLPLLVLILWYTGLSRIDACNLEWSQVDLENCRITGFRKKTQTPFVVPFMRDGELHKALLEHAKDAPMTGYVSERNHLRGSTPSRQTIMARHFAAACKAAGMPEHSGPHSFRRAFITRLVKAGVRDHTITKMSGHRNASMLDTYYKPTHDDLAKAIAIIDPQPVHPAVLPNGSEGTRPAVDQPTDR